MRRFLPLLLLAAPVGCGPGPGGGRASEENRIAVGPVTPRPPDRCRAGGDEEECADLLPAEHLQGVWVTGFEQSGFIPDATGTPGRDDVRAQQTWLAFARGTTPDRSVWEQRDGRGGRAAFAIEFEGRRSRGPSPNGGYGHLNGAANLVVVDRIISLRILPPR